MEDVKFGIDNVSAEESSSEYMDGDGVNSVQRITVNRALPQLERPITYITGLEKLNFQVANFPLGIPEEHIQAMIEHGILKSEHYHNNPIQPIIRNPVTDPSGSKMKDANGHVIFENITGRRTFTALQGDETIPQIIGYRIHNDTELERIILDPELREAIRSSVARGEDYPIINMPNERAHHVYAAYLGGSIPSHEELLSMIDALPGVDMIEKIRFAGIPVAGGLLTWPNSKKEELTIKNALSDEGKKIVLRTLPSNINEQHQGLVIEVGYDSAQAFPHGFASTMCLLPLVIFRDKSLREQEKRI